MHGVHRLKNEQCVLLSFDLLFQNDRRSRSYYQTHERTHVTLTHRERKPTAVDYLLDERCGKALTRLCVSPGASVRESYDMDADFPIFKACLQLLQDHMEGIAANQFSSLWRDRRNLRLWYTIWNVIIRRQSQCKTIEALGLHPVRLHRYLK